MKVTVEIDIQGSKEEVWRIISDIENSASNISGIDKIEILDHPKDSLVGLKWVETRTLFGKTAVETMWITEAFENNYYQTRAESHGAVYVSVLKITGSQNGSRLTMEFNSYPQTFGAKIMGLLLGTIFKKAMIKALKKDLSDIKAVVESKKSQQKV